MFLSYDNRAAFQFGVKMNDGRKTRRQKSDNLKDNSNAKKPNKDNKIDAELKKINAMESKGGGGGGGANSGKNAKRAKFADAD